MEGHCNRNCQNMCLAYREFFVACHVLGVSSSPGPNYLALKALTRLVGHMLDDKFEPEIYDERHNCKQLFMRALQKYRCSRGEYKS